MRALSAPTTTALASANVVLAQLILMEFSTGAVALNTSTFDLVWAGVTYKGAYGLGQISAIEDAGGVVKGLQYSISGVSSAAVAMALDGADVVQGTPLTIRTAVIDADTFQIIDAPIDWTGLLDTMSITEDGAQSTVSITAESSAVDLLHGYNATYSNASQQTVYPGDKAMEYVIDQDNKPVVWPAKAWFYQ